MKLIRNLFVVFMLSMSMMSAIYPTTPIAYAQAKEAVYVGSSETKKFHRPSCIWAKKIKPANSVTFKSKADAVKAGYAPCKVCKP